MSYYTFSTPKFPYHELDLNQHPGCNKTPANFRIECHFETPCTCWSNADEKEKDMWWNIFKTRCNWQPEIEDGVRNGFNKTAARRLKDMVYKAMKAKKCRPWMSKHVRKGIRKMRQMDQFKKKSTIFSNNRKPKEGRTKGVAHIQGSVSAKEYAYRLYNEKNTVLTPAEWFRRTHMRKDGTWVDDKSKDVWDTYSMKAQGAFPSSHEDRDAFLEAAGGIRKDGTIYGIGNATQFYYSKSKSRKPSKPLPPSSIIVKLQKELESSKDELKSTRGELKSTREELEEQKKRSEEHTKKTDEESKELMKVMINFKKDMDRMSQAMHCSEFSIHTPKFHLPNDAS